MAIIDNRKNKDESNSVEEGEEFYILKVEGQQYLIPKKIVLECTKRTNIKRTRTNISLILSIDVD